LRLKGKSSPGQRSSRLSWEDLVSGCIKCGSCLSVCPIYLETGRESLVARGKLALLSNFNSKELPADKDLYDLLSYCLLCGACAENCASGVRADDLIQQGRSLLIEKAGAANWKKFLAGSLMPFPERLKFFRTGQGLLFKKIPEDRGLKLRFSSDPRIWPAMAAPFFLDQKFPSHIIQKEISKPRLGFFVGCTTNYVYPEVGEAVLKLLDPFGKVILPKDQTCCGLPAFSMGDIKTARDLARRNVLAFSREPMDSILIACASCATHIIKDYPELLAEETDLRTETESFLNRVEELSRYLCQKDLSGIAPKERRTLSVAFHDPCHAKRKLKLTKEPRELLRSVPGLSLVELKGRCCGHGGLFSLSHPEDSQKILGHPLGDLDECRAEVLATSCMACLMQFKLGVQRTGRNVKVKHWAELMV
jgi:glycolate oxidase iron-sulfur subunit